MIPELEFHSISRSLGVPLPHVEKDYVMGWLVWGLAQEPFLRERLVLKGGNCLRKLYFPDTRFSDDLDFTTTESLSGVVFRPHLERILGLVSETSGISFSAERTRVDEAQTPDPDEQALDARVYFRGMAGDATVVFRVKFDVSPYERIVLPLQDQPLIHGYSDANICQTSVRGYALEEVLAEKLRSWIQRTRARDLFDAAKIISSGRVSVRKTDILKAFLQKTLFKGIPNVARDELLSREKFAVASGHWLTSIVCPVNAVIVAANAIELFIQFVTALFAAERIVTGGIRPQHGAVGAIHRIPSTIREAIISAGRSRQLIALTYSGLTRLVEPYALKFKVRKDGFAGEYFYGYDRTKDQSIKSFLLNKVQAANVRSEAFTPRFNVEF
jgi:predicted nucleotidyltransferase component of viral defense system